MRKELGLLALFSAAVHSSLYLVHFHEIVDPEQPTWQDKGFMTAGVLAFLVIIILGVTSLPSVMAALSWREFRALHSFLGWTALILSTTHCVFAGLVPLANGDMKVFTWEHCVFFDTKQLPLALPLPTILLKLPLILLSSRLNRIRQGFVY